MESNCCTVSRVAATIDRMFAYLNAAGFPAAALRTAFSGIRFVALPWRVLFDITRDFDASFVAVFVMVFARSLNALLSKKCAHLCAGSCCKSQG
jgi:hypothetical protein